MVMLCGCQKPAETDSDQNASSAPRLEQVPAIPALSPDGVPTGPAVWTIVGREFVVIDINGREILRRPLGVTGIYTDLDWQGSSLWASYKEGETVREVHRLDPSSGYILLKLNAPAADGLALTDEGLWLSDSGNNRMLLIRPTNGEPLRSVNIPSPGALAWDGTALWVVQNGSYRIRSFDPATMLSASVSLPIPPPIAPTNNDVPKAAIGPQTPTANPVLPSVTQPNSLSEMNTPGPNVTGLDWNGQYLIAADPNAGKLFFLSAKDGSVAGQLFLRGVTSVTWQPRLAEARKPRTLQ